MDIRNKCCCIINHEWLILSTNTEWCWFFFGGGGSCLAICKREFRDLLLAWVCFFFFFFVCLFFLSKVYFIIVYVREIGIACTCRLLLVLENRVCTACQCPSPGFTDNPFYTILWRHSILHHRGVQLILAYSWARPAILVVSKGRGGMFLFLLFLHFHSCSSFFPVPLFHLLYSLFCLFSPFLWETTQNDPQGLTCC